MLVCVFFFCYIRRPCSETTHKQYTNEEIITPCSLDRLVGVIAWDITCSYIGKLADRCPSLTEAQ